MAVCLSPENWFTAVKDEYLQDFIKDGGAAVKFVVPVDGSLVADIVGKLRHQAEESGYFFTGIDSANVKIHQVEQVFFQVARQVDWEGVVSSFLYNLLKNHYRLPEDGSRFNLKQIAALNGYEEREMRHAINNRLRDAVFRDYHMTQEFRIALILLCRHQLDPDESSSNLILSLKEWLRGELKLVSTLKPALIFQKIGRHNARNMLASLVHWLKLSGKSGLVLLLDITHYTLDRPREPDGTLYFSTAAVLDCYEVLRQFIDGTDESEYCFITILAPVRFLDESDKKRSAEAYQALKLRIWDEIRDKKYTDPVAPLVRLSCCQAVETG
jgi:hypothetical protein